MSEESSRCCVLLFDHVEGCHKHEVRGRKITEKKGQHPTQDLSRIETANLVFGGSTAKKKLKSIET